MAPRRRKSSVELAIKLPEKVVQAHGGALYRGGVPGHRGGSGQLPDDFKRRMAECVSRQETQRELDKILADADHPHFMKALEFAAARGFGAVKQEVSLEGGATILIAPIPRG